MKRIQLILAAASLVGATGLNAQAKPKTEQKVYSPSKEECVSRDGNTECRIFRFKEDSSLIKRAMIGVSVQTTGTKRDTLGVFIASVTPDGPAEKAGIVEGERIAAINGVDLRVAAADVEDSYTAGIASHRLTREVQKLTPGATVTLRVVSGGRSRDVQVVTARASDLMKLHGPFGMVFPGGQLMQPGMPGMPGFENLRIMRENLEPLREMRINPNVRIRTTTPLRIAPKAPVHLHIDDEDVITTPAAVPAPPKPAVISGKFRTSI